jgi:hypothetical protein
MNKRAYQSLLTRHSGSYKHHTLSLIKARETQPKRIWPTRLFSTANPLLPSKPKNSFSIPHGSDFVSRTIESFKDQVSMKFSDNVPKGFEEFFRNEK